MTKFGLLFSIIILVSQLVWGQAIGDYRSRQSGNWSNLGTWERYNGSTWPIPTSGEGVPSSASGVITIQSPNVIAIASSDVTVDQMIINSGGQVTIALARKMTITNETGTDLTVNGLLVNAGSIAFNPGVTASFGSGSTYQHQKNGGFIPTATWNANSTCLITGIVNTVPSGMEQTFGHLTWNCPDQTTTTPLANRFTVSGNFTLTSTGSGGLQLDPGSTTITGNYSQTGGLIRLAGSNTTSLNVGGSFSLSGGTLLISYGSATGTLNVAGNFSHTSGTIDEDASGSGSIIFNGTGNQNFTSGGTVSNTINFTVNSGAKLYLGTNLLGNGSIGTFTLSSGGTLGIGHADGISTTSGVGNIRVTGSKTYSTGANYIYNGIATQVTGNGLPTSAITGNVTIENTTGVTPTNSIIINTPEILTVTGLLTPTATQTISGTGTLAGTGTVLVTRTSATADFSSQYSITNKTQTNLTVDYGGAAAQIISALTYGGLKVNNASGVTLGGNTTVNGAFTLTNGLVTLGSNNLILGSSATIGGTPSATAMVVPTGSGELRKTFTGTGSFTFPVGDNNVTAEYSPATLNFTSGSFSSAYAGVKLVNSKHPNNSSANHFINRYWTVSSSGISGFSCNSIFTYVDGDIIGTEANLYCGKWDGLGWTLLNAVDANNNQLSGTVTSFSDFTGGESAPLPVELSSFSASIIGSAVKLNWRTETEINNYGFEIQKSQMSNVKSETDWEKIGFVEGYGNSNSPKDYSFTDASVISGTYSYRLKQIDIDGQFEYSKAIEIGLAAPDKFELSQNFPNPFNPNTSIKFTLPETGYVKLTVYNMLGQEIATLVNGVKEAGTHIINFNAEEFNSGIYIYRIESNGFNEVRKMTLIK